MFSTLLTAYRRNLNDMNVNRENSCEQCLCKVVAGMKVMTMIACTAIGYLKDKANHYMSNVEHSVDGTRVITYRNTCGKNFRLVLRDNNRSGGFETYYFCSGYSLSDENTRGDMEHKNKCRFCTDVTKHVHIYGGPRWDFHGNYITPKELGYDHIYVEDLMTGKTKLIKSDDKISL